MERFKGDLLWLCNQPILEFCLVLSFSCEGVPKVPRLYILYCGSFQQWMTGHCLNIGWFSCVRR